MRPGQRDYRVVIQSRDQRPFRVKRIECEVSGIQGRAADSAAALTQSVLLEGFPQSKSKDRRRWVVSQGY